MTSVHQARDVRIFHKMCVSLAQAGYETTLVAPGESFTESGVTVLGVGKKPASRVKRMTQTARRVYEKALEVDADLYHFHDPELLPYGLKLKRRGKVVVFDSHEFTGYQISTKQWLPGPIRSVVKAAYMRYEAYVCRRLDAVVEVCTINGQDYFANRARKTQFIANYPRLDEFDLSKSATAAAGTTPYVCYVGGLSYSRGITHLVEACQLIGVRLCLAGPFMSEAYEAQLRAMPGWDNVDYRGVLSREKVASLISGATAGMATLLNVGQYFSIDTQAIKVYEYMACGIPSIVFDSPFNLRFMQENGCGLCVKPDDPQAIAQAIRSLLDDPQAAKSMGENGRKAIVTKYNWDVEAKKLLALYASLLPTNAAL